MLKAAAKFRCGFFIAIFIFLSYILNLEVVGNRKSAPFGALFHFMACAYKPNSVSRDLSIV